MVNSTKTSQYKIYKPTTKSTPHLTKNVNKKIATRSKTPSPTPTNIYKDSITYESRVRLRGYVKKPYFGQSRRTLGIEGKSTCRSREGQRREMDLASIFSKAGPECVQKVPPHRTPDSEGPQIFITCIKMHIKYIKAKDDSN